MVQSDLTRPSGMPGWRQQLEQPPGGLEHQETTLPVEQAEQATPTAAISDADHRGEHLDAQFKAPLTAQDRCDGCGQEAQTRALLPSGRFLLFCGHCLGTNGAGASKGSATRENLARSGAVFWGAAAEVSAS